MSKVLGALIGAACICVIVATGWWGWGQYRDTHPEKSADVAILGDGSGLAKTCDDVLISAAKGDMGPAIQKAKEGSPEAFVKSCRDLIAKRKAGAARTAP